MPFPSVIALDGPPASGKTTVGEAIAQKLGHRSLDTGLLYRAAAWGVLREGIPLHDVARLVEICQGIEAQQADAQNRWEVRVCGVEITDELGSPEVERAVSAIAAVPEVRAALLSLQRRLAQGGRIVVAGQDIGSVVLPHADLKIFLQASLEERARRRAVERSGADASEAFDQAHAALIQRSAEDARRTVAPVLPAPDAIVVDTEGRSVEEVVELILRLAQRDP